MDGTKFVMIYKNLARLLLRLKLMIKLTKREYVNFIYSMFHSHL